MKSQKYIFVDYTKFEIDISKNQINMLEQEALNFFTKLYIVASDFVIDIIDPFATNYKSESKKHCEELYYNSSAVFGILENIKTVKNIDVLDIKILRKALNTPLTSFKSLYNAVLNYINITDEHTFKKLTIYNENFSKIIQEFENLYKKINSILEEKEKLLDSSNI